MRRLRIGISMRIVEARDYHDPRDALSLDWGTWFQRVMPEATVVPLLNVAGRIEDWIQELGLHGVVLSGGNDWGSAPQRDATERRIVAFALERGLPILGTCRGLHALNKILGGGLTEDLAKAVGRSHVAVEHVVRISDTRFALTEETSLVVNSYHEQGVLEADLSPDLRTFAVSEDGVVEGAYHPGRPALAIQWHPERRHPSQHYDLRVFERFFSEGAFWGAESSSS